jgi:hypothetical protein
VGAHPAGDVLARRAQLAELASAARRQGPRASSQKQEGNQQRGRSTCRSPSRVARSRGEHVGTPNTAPLTLEGALVDMTPPG